MDSQAGTDHTAQLVQLGLDMIRSTRRFTNALSGKFLEVQLGISSGPTSAGVISAALPRESLVLALLFPLLSLSEH
eukprot:3848092-Rhodomonas_salina.1